MTNFALGLIGDHIGSSKAPLLHRLASRLSGISVRYDLLIPSVEGLDFERLLDRCAQEGYRGVNVTHPYKEAAASLVTIDDPLVCALGAVNTVVFEIGGPKGYNTDYSGFGMAYRHVFHGQPAGNTCIVGTGGAGRAVAFALLRLGVGRIRLFDTQHDRAVTVAEALHAYAPHAWVEVADTVEAAVRGMDGVVNCSPIGMDGHGGTPVPAELLQGATWVFDAVYTPMSTQFLQDVKSAGLEFMSGYELFLYQGVAAFEIFCGRPVDEQVLRAVLLAADHKAV